MEAERVERMIDAAIRGAQVINDEKRPPRLIAQCAIQSATADRLQALHEEGIIGTYTMPCAHLVDGCSEVKVHVAYELVGDPA